MQRFPIFSLLVLIAFAMGSVGCQSFLSTGPNYDYFARPHQDDAWSPKIGQWQRRARADRDRERPLPGPATVATPTPTRAAIAPHPSKTVTDSKAEIPASAGANTSAVLAAEAGTASPEPAAPLVRAVTPSPADASLREKYRDFRSERRRALARDLSGWIQEQAQQHYRPDDSRDHWATLEETLRSNGDDCDGLELLVYDALLALGFDATEVYRAIVYRPEDLQHHMVTLWFEDPEDPWVIDPTGAMTDSMQRMSDLPGWVPLKVFGLHYEYSVQPVARQVAQNFPVVAPVAYARSD